MNKQDCEDLGYLLSEFSPISWKLCEAIFAMDDRIESEYYAFQEVKGISDEIIERAEELVIEYNGPHWSMKNILPGHKTYAECLSEARIEINGED